ncbi:MAG: holo-ACP synthase [Magnetococcales bacterium]|nr:holo-ACP synthase [Magnetococcales bacterium]MBF0155924.1 holo-ACP synthase [Magnetococcales bacterium]
MILGIGTDLVEIERIEEGLRRFGERLERRLFTPAESRLCEARRAQRSACFAKRFAAKEALVKALGTGMREGIWFTDIEVLPGNDGQPFLFFSGETGRRLAALGQLRVHLSLSDERGFALAMVVLERVRRDAPSH